MGKPTVKIRANDEAVAGEVLNFIAQSESQMIGFIDQRLRSQGYGDTDIVMTINDENKDVVITTNPEDKGNVFVLEEGYLVEVPYSDVEHEEFYVYIQDGRAVVMHKFEDGVDRKVNIVKNIKMIKDFLEGLPDEYAVMKAQQEKMEELRAEQESQIAEAEVVEDEEDLAVEPETVGEAVMEVVRDEEPQSETETAPDSPVEEEPLAGLESEMEPIAEVETAEELPENPEEDVKED